MSNPYNVKVGQIYQDWDVRFRNKEPIFKRVIKIEGDYAIVEGKKGNSVISKSKIRLNRFRPNSTGYRLIEEQK
jgi:hypothetical protein